MLLYNYILRSGEHTQTKQTNKTNKQNKQTKNTKKALFNQFVVDTL